MTKQQLLSQALKTIEHRRYVAQYKCDKLNAKLNTVAEWKTLNDKLRAITVDIALCNNADSSTLQTKYKQLTSQRKEMLDRFHLSESDLVPKYSCSKCNDTGYIFNTTCDCLKEEMRKLMVAQSDIIHADFTFKNSTETDKHNLSVYRNAQKACDENKNILLVGDTGNGKTYLLTCCANYAINKGKTVMFVTAYNLNNTFLQCHLGSLETKQIILQNLSDVDVLAIDDLGTESVYKNVTAEYLYSVINDRLSRGKQTFVSTNLELTELREKYDERIFSRLLDKSTTFVAQLTGKDKRVNL